MVFLPVREKRFRIVLAAVSFWAAAEAASRLWILGHLALHCHD